MGLSDKGYYMGRFKMSGGMIREDPDIAQLILSQTIPVRVVYDEISDTYACWGWSKKFKPFGAHGADVPWYDVVVERDNSRTGTSPEGMPDLRLDEEITVRFE